MKKIFTLLLSCFVINGILSQQLGDKFLNISEFKNPIVSGNPAISSHQYRFRTVCLCSVSPEPVWVVDGVVYEKNKIDGKKIAPEDIEEIVVLKGSNAIALCGDRGENGVIIVNTKQSKIRKFIVKDFLDGSFIAGATVSFISANKKDTLMGLTNDRGVITIDKLKAGTNYEIQVSSIGYKDVFIPYKTKYGSDVREILLERNIKNCLEVVVSSSGKLIRCYSGGCIIRRIIKSEVKDSTQESSVYKTKIFPNPVQKNKSVTIELLSNNESILKLRMINMAGNILYEQKQKLNLGLNRISIALDSRWASGTYIIELINEKNERIHQQKLIIQ